MSERENKIDRSICVATRAMEDSLGDFSERAFQMAFLKGSLSRQVLTGSSHGSRRAELSSASDLLGHWRSVRGLHLDGLMFAGSGPDRPRATGEEIFN